MAHRNTYYEEERAVNSALSEDWFSFFLQPKVHMMTGLLEEFTGGKRFIDALRGYGYRVSIDDFGAGYADISIWAEDKF